MDDRDWLIIRTLYKYKNVTRTAQKLFMSQPTLTTHIKSIEGEFGASIVERTKKGVQFTPQGEYLAKTADEMLYRIRAIKETVVNMSDDVAGTLLLGASFYVTEHMLPKLLAAYKDRYPKVEFKVVAGASKDVVNMIYNKDIHVGFVRGDYSWGDRKFLLMEEPVCIASKDEIDFRQLPSLPRIDYRGELMAKLMLDNWWREHFDKPPSIIMEVENVDACREMVRHGLGYALMTRIIVEYDNLYKMNLIHKNGEPVLRRTWMFYHKESLQLPLIKAFVDLVSSYDFGMPFQKLHHVE